MNYDNVFSVNGTENPVKVTNLAGHTDDWKF